MTISVLDLSAPSGAKLYANTDLDATIAAIKASAGTLYSIIIDNSANAAASYLKLWDLASGSVTVGTTAPDWIIKIAASVKKTIVFPEGLAFATALSAACVTAGGTAGVTGPTSDVDARLVYA